jgi:hypothetical protein
MRPLATRKISARLYQRQEVGHVVGTRVGVTTELPDIEAGRAHQRWQVAHQQRVVDQRSDRSFDARLQRIVRAGGHGRRGVVSVENDQPSAER